MADSGTPAGVGASSQGAGRLGHRAAPSSLCGEEAVQSIKPAAGTQPAPHSFPSVPGFTAPASSPPFPPLVTPPQRLRRRRGLLSATRRYWIPSHWVFPAHRNH